MVNLKIYSASQIIKNAKKKKKIVSIKKKMLVRSFTISGFWLSALENFPFHL